MTTVALPDETKETLTNILTRAASQERTVVEFRTDNSELTALDITDHVAELEGDLE